MKIEKNNIYTALQEVTYQAEVFESIVESENVFIEKISTLRPYSEPGKWVSQEKDEWVMLMQGEAVIEFQDNGSIELEKGDYFLIPAKTKHRVAKTTEDPKCIWLAVHGNLKQS